jgi:hypothetical protein
MEQLKQRDKFPKTKRKKVLFWGAYHAENKIHVLMTQSKNKIEFFSPPNEMK